MILADSNISDLDSASLSSANLGGPKAGAWIESADASFRAFEGADQILEPVMMPANVAEFGHQTQQT
jgi:hypothetical protein